MSDNHDKDKRMIKHLREENAVSRRRIEVKEVKEKILKQMINNIKNKAGKREE